jgi:hypothetical protein
VREDVLDGVDVMNQMGLNKFPGISPCCLEDDLEFDLTAIDDLRIGVIDEKQNGSGVFGRSNTVQVPELGCTIPQFREADFEDASFLFGHLDSVFGLNE